jgi:hypothetical protein
MIICMSMTGIDLHYCAKRSVQKIIPPEYNEGFRHLLESGGCEKFLRDLLAIELTASGHTVIRERPFAERSVDLVLVQEDIYVEAKQLHLKTVAAGFRILLTI